MTAIQGELVTLEDLLAMPAPEPQGPRHHPAPHGEVVLAVLAELERAGRHPQDMKFSIDRDDDRLYGRIVLGEDLALKEAQRAVLRESRKETYTGINESAVNGILERAGLAGAFGEALVIRHANDRSMSLRIEAAAQFYICNNLAVGESGGSVRRRHVGDDDWTELAGRMTVQVLRDLPVLSTTLSDLATVEVEDQRAKAIFWDIMTMRRRPIAPKLIEQAAETYFAHATEDVTNPTALAIHQSLTRQLRGLGQRREILASQTFLSMLRSEFAAVEPELPVAN